MRLLVIGGTRFMGRHAVEAALARGHEVTLFHRGRTGAELFEVEQIVGDRDGETDKLAGREWDAVLDTCGYFPRIVEQSAYQLADQVGLYCFVSSISVYEDRPGPLSEEAEVLRFAGEPPKEEITGESYGPFKALCEEAIERICGPRSTLIVRPGLIVGPHDPTDRFTYWVDRFSGATPVLVTQRPGQQVQFIDARDLGEFTIDLIGRAVTGAFNAVGPEQELSIGELWDACRSVGGGTGPSVPVSDDFLSANEVAYWTDLPLTMPPTENFIASNAKAIAAGLKFRPLDQTVRDTLNWHRARESDGLKAGLKPEREAELIARWRESGAPRQN